MIATDLHLQRESDGATVAAMTMADRDLLAHYVLCDSAEAFATIVKRYTPLVYASCRRILRRDDLAKDAAQATFIVLSRKAAGLKEQVILAGWLYQTASNAARTLLRQELRRAHREDGAAYLNDVAAPPVGGGGGEWEGAIDSEISALPALYREPLVLHYLQRMDFRAVAAALGCAEPTARMRASRAIHMLRLQLRKRQFAASVTVLGAYLGAQAGSTAAVLPGALASGGLFGAGTAGTAAASAKATATAATVIKGLALAQAKLVAGVATAVVLTGAGVLLAVVTLRPPPPPVLASHPAMPPAVVVTAPAPVPAPVPDRRRLLEQALARWLDPEYADVEQALFSDETTPELQPVRALAATVTDAEIPTFLAGLDLSPGAALIKLELLPRWGRADAVAALAWVDKLPPGPGRGHFTAAVLQGWARRDTVAALAWLQAMPAGISRNAATQRLATLLGREQPQEALKLLGTPLVTALDETLLPRVLWQWAEKLPAAAIAWVQHRPSGRARRQAFAGVAEAWGRSDAAGLRRAVETGFFGAPAYMRQNGHYLAALELGEKRAPGELLAALPPTPYLELQAAIVYTTWAEQAPGPAWAAIRARVRPEASFLRQALRHIVIRQPALAPDMAAFLGQAQGPNRNLEFLLYHWGAVDLEAALAWLKQQPDGTSQKKAALTGVIGLWARRDPVAALAFLQTQPDWQNSPAVVKLIWGWGLVDGPAARTFAANQLKGLVRDRAVVAGWAGAAYSGTAPIQEHPEVLKLIVATGSYVPLTWAAWTDAPQTLKWLQTLPTPEGRLLAMGPVVLGMTLTDPGAVWRLLDGMPRNTPGWRRALEQLTLGWTVVSPAAALDWALALPVQAEREAVLRQWFYTLALHAPAQAASLQVRLPETVRTAELQRQALAVRDFPAARQAFLALPDRRATGKVRQLWKTSENILIARRSDPDSERQELLPLLLRPWMEEAPQEAVALLLGLSTGDARANGLRTAFNYWKSFDPAGAQSWVYSLPPAEAVVAQSHDGSNAGKTAPPSD